MFLQVFERIKAIANADTVTQAKACYVFELDGKEGKYCVELKECDGQAGEEGAINKSAASNQKLK